MCYVDLGESFHMSIYYLLAKFGFDTAENEPCKRFPLSVYIFVFTQIPQVSAYHHLLKMDALLLWTVFRKNSFEKINPAILA